MLLFTLETNSKPELLDDRRWTGLLTVGSNECKYDGCSHDSGKTTNGIYDGTDLKDETISDRKPKQSLHINLVSYAKRRS